MKTKKLLHLREPQTFNEKLQWLKLYWRDDLLTRCADKYQVRDFVAERTSPQILKSVYGLYERAEDIDWSQLPDSFIFKVTHGSGQNIKCHDLNQLDKIACCRVLDRYLRNNHYYYAREWGYKNIPPRILCEELLQGDEPLYDYNFFCYYGLPRVVEVVCEYPSSRHAMMYDMDWNIVPRIYRQSSPFSMPLEKPAHFAQMEDIACRLSQDFPFVRIDLQYFNGRVYFGEMTFYPLAGIAVFDPSSLDRDLGSYLTLPRNRCAPAR